MRTRIMVSTWVAALIAAAALYTAFPKEQPAFDKLGFFAKLSSYDASYPAESYESDYQVYSTYQPPQEGDPVGKLIDKIINSKP